jgi:transposase
MSGGSSDEVIWWTVGVDCGEERHRFVLLDEGGKRRGAFWVANRSDKIREGVTKAALMLPGGARLRMVTEGLRSLGWVLTQIAFELGMQVWQVNPKALKHYRDLEGQPRKDDDIDAFLAARMVVFGMEGCRVAADPRPEERALCRITRLRTEQKKRRTAVANRLRSRLVELAPEAVSSEWNGPAYNGKGMRAVLRRWPAFEGLERARVSTIEKLLRSSTRHGSKCREMAVAVRDMAARIVIDPVEREVVKLDLGMAVDELDVLDGTLTKLKKEITQRIKNHPVGQKLMAMPGEGIITAATDVGEVLPVARNVSEGKTATYVGITPLSRISGKGGKKSKLARGVNKHAARTNYLSAVAATSASAIDAAYHRKQLERHQGHARPYVKATLSLARQRFKVKYKLMTTDAVYDKEILIASHFDRQRRREAQRRRSNVA